MNKSCVDRPDVEAELHFTTSYPRPLVEFWGNSSGLVGSVLPAMIWIKHTLSFRMSLFIFRRCNAMTINKIRSHTRKVLGDTGSTSRRVKSINAVGSSTGIKRQRVIASS